MLSNVGFMVSGGAGMLSNVDKCWNLVVKNVNKCWPKMSWNVRHKFGKCYRMFENVESIKKMVKECDEMLSNVIKNVIKC
jgi:translation initiation factor 2 alpha subunit (eIF-2alpha)